MKDKPETPDLTDEEKKNLRPVMKPKKVKHSYMNFSIERLRSGAHSDVKITERTKLIAAEWKLMTDVQKKKYEQMTIEDKARFEKETKQFNELGYFFNAKGEKSSDILPELKDFSSDTVMPKKKTTSMLFYIGQNFKNIAEKNGLTGKDQFKVAGIASEMWKSLSDSEKKTYEDLSA